MDLIPQLIGLIIGILGAYSLVVAVRKRYPGVDAFFSRLTGQSTPTTNEEPVTQSVTQNPLEDTNWQIRRDAILALSGTSLEDARPTLLIALADSDLDVREAAGQVLGDMGVEAIPVLIETLQHGQMEARIEAAKALGKIGDSRASMVLKTALSEDDSVWVRAAAAEALGHTGGDVLTALTEALKDERIVQEAAIRGLEHLDTRAARKFLRQLHTS